MHLLPQHVKKYYFEYLCQILNEFLRSNTQRKVLTDNYKDATLLFADIAGFTEYSSQVEPEQVVNMLRNLFTEFDKTCLAQKAYKLYTIGDCYVAFGAIDANDRDPAQEARNIVEFGLHMVSIIKEVRSIIKYQGLDMRIGIHTGNFIGGVLGTDIVRYDLYGADVVIANKMESNGKKGEVHISEETKQLLESQFEGEFEFEEYAHVEIKAINRATQGYLVRLKASD